VVREVVAGLIAAYGFNRARTGRPAARLFLSYVAIRFPCIAAELAAALYLMSLDPVTVPDPRSEPGGCAIYFYPTEIIWLALFRQLLLSVPLLVALALLLLICGKSDRITHLSEAK
jgi:hypothetical protein